MIGKNQSDPDNYKIAMFYYHKARDAMFDAVSRLVENGYRDIFIPGYIGWSPKEGSGIFDPLNAIDGLKRHYYRITRSAEIDTEDLDKVLTPHGILLTVSYFGFRDRKLPQIIEMARQKECLIIEDDAHGFFTWFCHGAEPVDVAFFSLHKMFPFPEGGALLIPNKSLDLTPRLCLADHSSMDPFDYDINAISRKRKENFRTLMSLCEGNEELFTPLRTVADLGENVPQTFPVVINRGDRFKIYEMLNEQGYGVVSLYHTLINELRTGDHEEAVWLSARVLNLPVHQDSDPADYPLMMKALKDACLYTERR